jgi:hypothetical protein
MRYLKNYSLFLEAGQEKTAPVITPTRTKPSTTPRPRRPSIVPTERPGEEDAPLATAEDAVKRLNKVYSELNKTEKSEINKYFEKK